MELGKIRKNGLYRVKCPSCGKECLYIGRELIKLIEHDQIDVFCNDCTDENDLQYQRKRYECYIDRKMNIIVPDEYLTVSQLHPIELQPVIQHD